MFKVYYNNTDHFISDGYTYWEAAKEAIESGIPKESITSIVEIEINEDENESHKGVRWHKDGVLVYLNGYQVYQCFGGPEEGGWYYDSHSPLSSQACELICDPTQSKNEVFKDQLEKTKNLLVEYFGDRYPKTSAAGGSDIEVYIEYEMAKIKPDYKPHYC